MMPSHIRALRRQLALTGQELADRINDADGGLRLDRNAISRYERGIRTPDYRVAIALTRLWLHEGYPCTVDGHPATLTTNHAASSFGQPVVLIDGTPHGPADVSAIDLGDAPETVLAAMVNAGYKVT